MIKIERILCPTDLSTEADEALRYALALAKAYRAKLMLVYCKERGSVAGSEGARPAPDLFKLSLFSRLDAHELKTLDWTGVVCEGDDVGVTIIAEAQKWKADLIVMRSRRRPRAASQEAGATNSTGFEPWTAKECECGLEFDDLLRRLDRGSLLTADSTNRLWS